MKLARWRLLAVFAHPDDETFRCGGTLALLSRQGVQVQVVTATRGENGSCGDPPLCSPGELPARREKELRCACDALGIEPPYLWGYQDGHLSEVDSGELVARILDATRQLRPHVMLTFGPDGLSGHPDHIAIGRCAATAFTRADVVAACYTLALPQSVAEHFGLKGMQPVPDEAITLAVDITPVWESKRAAIHCHATQLSASPLMRASVEEQRQFFGIEYFVRTALRRPERDLLWRMIYERHH